LLYVSNEYSAAAMFNRAQSFGERGSDHGPPEAKVHF